MRNKLIFAWLICVGLALGALILQPAWFSPLSPKTFTNIYDGNADGSRQIALALARAKIENKRVLLQFGANWCVWCHKLHDLFDSDADIASGLKSDYVVVLIDVNQGRNQETVEKYGQPTKFGLPVIVILDADGRQLVTQNTADLVEDTYHECHDPQKVVALLQKWAPPSNPQFH